MRNSTVGDAAIAVVRRNTEEVQGNGNWNLYEELFADDFIDHTPQPGTTPDKDGVRVLYNLGGHLKTGQSWTGQNRPVGEPPQARVLYRVRA